MRDGSLSASRTERSPSEAIERLIDILVGFGLPAFVRDRVYVVTQKRVRIRDCVSAVVFIAVGSRDPCQQRFLQARCSALPGIRRLAGWQAHGGQPSRVVHGWLLIHYK